MNSTKEYRVEALIQAMAADHTIRLEETADYEAGFDEGYRDGNDRADYQFRARSMDDQTIVDALGNPVIDSELAKAKGYIEGYMQAVWDNT